MPNEPYADSHKIIIDLKINKINNPVSLITPKSTVEFPIDQNKPIKETDLAEFKKDLYKPIKKTGLMSSIFFLIISYIIYMYFDLSTNQLQFVREYYNLGFYDICLGMDGSSIYFVVRPLEKRSRKSFRCKGEIIKFREFLKVKVPSSN